MSSDSTPCGVPSGKERVPLKDMPSLLSNHVDSEDEVQRDESSRNPQVHEDPLERSWEFVMKEVNSFEDNLIGGWKEDIDTLLVFAALFSAIVAAFTIESYKWLSEEAEDTTVALLRQISEHIINGTSSPPPPFEVSTSNLIINVLWFLSLMITLVDALFGLLCKQWLREHRRAAHTRTRDEALALRWLRYESLEGWGVPTILDCLSLFLEIALFVFLAGVLELLRTRHSLPFAIASGVVGFAGLSYVITMMIPSAVIIGQVLQTTIKLLKIPRSRGDDSHCYVGNLPAIQSICPYKSPQAWILLSVFRVIPRLWGVAPLLRFFRRSKNQWLHSVWAFWETMGTLESDWSDADLQVIRRLDIGEAPPFYELEAFRWLNEKLRDRETMRPYLQELLAPKSLRLVMPVVFGQWFVPAEGTWAEQHIDTALSSPPPPFSIARRPLPTVPDMTLNPVRQTKLLYRLLHWTNILSKNAGEDPEPLAELTKLLQNLRTLLQDGNFRDDVSLFSSIDRILDNGVATSGLDADLLRLFIEVGRSDEAPKNYWNKLMRQLARWITTSASGYALHKAEATSTSRFVQSNPTLIRQVHDIIIHKKIFSLLSARETMDWIEAMDIMQRVQNARRNQQLHKGPISRYRPIPGYFLLPLSKLGDGEALGRLSLANLEDKSRSLASFKHQWGATEWPQRILLAKTLSRHIAGYRPPDLENSLSPEEREAAYPLLTSTAGLDLILFVDEHLAKEEQKTRPEVSWAVMDGWREAAKCVSEIQPDLERRLASLKEWPIGSGSFWRTASQRIAGAWSR
ncbi:hypothetical protein PQX77_000321 [Marasmius sp. AFHP31]|nr:hypothetical protein PQX77_000321 [Marasmius sp. AFHP31]